MYLCVYETVRMRTETTELQATTGRKNKPQPLCRGKKQGKIGIPLSVDWQFQPASGHTDWGHVDVLKSFTANTGEARPLVNPARHLGFHRTVDWLVHSGFGKAYTV